MFNKKCNPLPLDHMVSVEVEESDCIVTYEDGTRRSFFFSIYKEFPEILRTILKGGDQSVSKPEKPAEVVELSLIHILAKLRLTYPQLPIVGIEPAVKPAVEHNHGGRILVMATPMTIRQEKFHKLLERHRNGKEVVPVPCEGLMEFVEHGELDGDMLEAYFREQLTPYLTEDTETIVLGCTHYPFLRRYLRKFLGERKIDLIDGSLGTAAELRRRLLEQGLLWKEPRERCV